MTTHSHWHFWKKWAAEKRALSETHCYWVLYTLTSDQGISACSVGRIEGNSNSKLEEFVWKNLFGETVSKRQHGSDGTTVIDGRRWRFRFVSGYNPECEPLSEGQSSIEHSWEAVQFLWCEGKLSNQLVLLLGAEEGYGSRTIFIGYCYGGEMFFFIAHCSHISTV